MSAASEVNLMLLRSVEKQTALYDRTDENYRKRLPSENAWDMVASEVGESVEKCKRRWRQLRNDYTRWCNADANRRRNGQRRLAYPLADELRFLDRHLNIADDMAADDDRSVSSDKDRDNNRDSEGGDHHPQASLKERASSTSKLVKEVKLASQVRKEKSSQDKRENWENPGDKQRSRKKSAEEKLDDLEESDEPEKVPELDSFLQSDNEDDECMDEEHLDDLEGFDFDLEQSNQEKELTPEKSLEKNNTDSTVSQPEFFVKQTRDPRLLIIGRKNSTSSFAESKASKSISGDPLETAMEDSGDEYGRDGEKRVTGSDTTSPTRRPRRAARASISFAGIRDLPIQKPGQAQRMTRLQRRKSMSLAAVHSVRSSTSPVKMTPVPRSQPINKPPSGPVQITKISHRDDIFPRPAVPSGVVNINQNQLKTQQQQKTLIFPTTDEAIANPHGSGPPQRRSVGRPPKKLPMVQRIVAPETQTKPQSPINTKVLTIGKPTSSVASGNINNIAIKSNVVTSISSSTATTNTITKGISNNSIKTTENVNVISYSPNSSSTSSSSKATTGASGAVITNIPTTTTAGTSVPVGKSITQLKMTERGTQTGVQNPFSDNYFLEMIKPQMQEMNPRQKMHFKKKVFQALMETFDDATDFPTSKELQHFNINTPSGFEHITDPELRLVRELVSMVSAAKVTLIRPPGEATAIATASRSGIAPEVQRGPRTNMTRQVIQRVYKPGTGQEIAPTSPAGGLDKRLFRLAAMGGKPNGNLSATQEILRKDSVDSNHSVVKVANHAPTGSPKGAAVVAAIRPQGSLINSFFGQGNRPTTAKGAASENIRAMSRRYSVCGSSNPPNAQNASQGSANGSTINSNASAMEASMLKRRLIAAGHGMVPPTQRPRYSAVGASQMTTASQGSSLLVRKSVGCVPAYQKQISPTGGASLLQKTPQIASVQGSAFNDFAQPKPAATASVNGEESSPTSALKRSLVVANTKTSFQDLLQQASQTVQRNKIESSETAATIAADDFSLDNLKREPVDPAEDHNDILGV